MECLTDPRVCSENCTVHTTYFGKRFLLTTPELEALNKETFNAGYDSGKETASLSIANARRQGRIEGQAELKKAQDRIDELEKQIQELKKPQPTEISKAAYVRGHNDGYKEAQAELKASALQINELTKHISDLTKEEEKRFVLNNKRCQQAYVNALEDAAETLLDFNSGWTYMYPAQAKAKYLNWKIIYFYQKAYMKKILPIEIFAEWSATHDELWK